jgi:hypothetical protein
MLGQHISECAIDEGYNLQVFTFLYRVCLAVLFRRSKRKGDPRRFISPSSRWDGRSLDFVMRLSSLHRRIVLVGFSRLSFTPSFNVYVLPSPGSALSTLPQVDASLMAGSYCGAFFSSEKKRGEDSIASTFKSVMYSLARLYFSARDVNRWDN